ncbi:MAG: sulfotransferase [Notoacmeibacter sp.]|nr:sulfotransferase [Notoacmeibacter sp.]
MSSIYDSRFFDRQSGESLRSARKVLHLLFGEHVPQSVLDVGCGVGPWLLAARELGVEDHFGIDGPWVEPAELLIEPTRFASFDLSRPVDLKRRFDLAISVEVAEHLPSESARGFVETLTRHADTVLFSSAIPYQGGDGHQNENWPEYWHQLFDGTGYEVFDAIRPQIWSDSDIAWWYRQNIMLYRRRNAPARFMPGAREGRGHALVHPEAFLRAVRRKPIVPPRTDFRQDVAYYEALCGGRTAPAHSYGPEFDYAGLQPKAPPGNYEELKQRASDYGSVVLQDALASVALRQPAPPPLSRGGTCPDFIGIGVQKAATTWMSRALQRHPEITMPGGKEVSFFNRRVFAPSSAYSGAWTVAKAQQMLRSYVQNNETMKPEWLRLLTHMMESRIDQAWYEALFRFYPLVPRRGDITPEYAQLPAGEIDQLLTFAPNVRILLMLRDPVERIVSHLSMIGGQVPNARPFLDQIALEPSVVDRSRYDEIVARWRSRLAPEQMLIIRTEDIASDLDGTVQRLSAFLGVDPQRFDAQALAQKHFVSDYKPVLLPDTLAHLRETLASAYDYFDQDILS